jgi:acyl dehydratase
MQGMTTVLNGIEELKANIGNHLGYSPWVEVTQEMVNQFAEATGDHQWIHVDVERAKAESPFGGPIAHGYLTLSFGPRLLPQIVRIEGFKLGVNYGAEKVRFPSPVPVGSKLRAGAEVQDVTEVSGGVQANLKITFEVEGSEKPACVAEVLFRYFV